jgi:hypothetical protein
MPKLSLMGFEVRTLPSFEKDAKPLLRKYPSLKRELLSLITSLEKFPVQGTPLGNDFYKIRLAIKSKKTGKSGGARVITCVKIFNEKVFLASIYDKSDAASISDEMLKLIAKQIPK